MGVAADVPGGSSGFGGQAVDELEAFRRLLAVVRRLRAPDGCPWDRAQTHATLRPYVLEEAREVVVAIGNGDAASLRDELGDLLLQVLLHAVIAEQEQAFSLADVCAGLMAKLLRRHPHVFGAVPPAASPQEAAAHWQSAKAEERRDGEAPLAGGLLASVPVGVSLLAEAWALGRKAASVGFDWPGPGEVAAKLWEEMEEFDAAWRAWQGQPDAARDAAGRAAARAHAEEELGDLLFAAVQVARILGIDAEAALLVANEKFRRRFGAMEVLLASEGRDWGSQTPAELDRAWERVKAAEAAPHGRHP